MRFGAIGHAYATLKDPQARAVYDQRGRKAGVKVAASPHDAGDDPGWMSLGNLVVAGLIVILVWGMWWYHDRQKAREEVKSVQRALKIVEDEKRKRAELADAEEQRRQASFEASQQRIESARERQDRLDAERTSRQVSMELRNAEREAEMRKRQEKAEREAQLRIQNEKRQLRELCMQRYNRTDC